MMTLGNAALTLRKSIETYLSWGCAHASCVNFVSRWSKSIVVWPGRPPKCVLGRRLWCSAIYVRLSAMHDERILAIVSSSTIGRYTFSSE